MKIIKVNKGDKFGMLNILEEVNKRGKHRYISCQCDCGKIKEIRLQHLREGNIINCGCKKGFKHGLTNTRFARIYNDILKRTNDVHNKNYGGKGIKCEWESLISFKNDMYESYLDHCKEFGEKQTTIDRINNNGNYYKENCIWATIKEQSRNKRSNVNITFNGKTQCLTDWCNELNLKYSTVKYRLDTGRTIEKAFIK